MADRMNALPTQYRGITYRSRTEARWAAFFDEMGIEAVYEGEGFDLHGVWYLPDFWLPAAKIWIEIKGGSPTTAEMDKAARLSALSGRKVFIAIGHPTTNAETYNLIGWDSGEWGAKAEPTRFADEGRHLIVIADRGYGVVEEIVGSESNLNGSPAPKLCLAAARMVQALRFGIHE